MSAECKRWLQTPAKPLKEKCPKMNNTQREAVLDAVNGECHVGRCFGAEPPKQACRYLASSRPVNNSTLIFCFLRKFRNFKYSTYVYMRVHCGQDFNFRATPIFLKVIFSCISGLLIPSSQKTAIPFQYHVGMKT